MWGNLSGVVGAALQKVQSLQNELENQMDQAVGNDGNHMVNSINPDFPELSVMTSPTINAPTVSSVGDMVDIDLDEKRSETEQRMNEPENRPISKGTDSRTGDSVEINKIHKAYQREIEDLRKELESISELRRTEKELRDALVCKESELHKREAQRNSEQQELIKKYEEIENQLRRELSSSRLDCEHLKSKVDLLEQAATSDESNESKTESDLKFNDALGRIHELEVGLSQCSFEKSALKETVDRQSAAAARMEEEAVNLRQIVSERERALEVAQRRLSEATVTSQQQQQRLTDLMNEIAEKDSRLRQMHVSAADEGDMRKQLARMQELLKEKDDKLGAFETEGQNLAKKQSEMEKVIRKSKGDLKAKDAEVAKLKESKEQLTKAIEEMQEVIRKHEADVSNTSKSLNAMQAVSSASTEKLTRLEAELNAKTEELAAQRRALEISWAENNDLKRSMAEMKAGSDDLRRQIGEGTSRVMETESFRREVEQREAVLRATSKQLQENLQRQMQESSAREERLHEELNELRKRWQEAINGREVLASELGNATAPLLRQISSLQDSMRLKSEHWQSIESSLTEKLLRAENNLELAEHRKGLLEEQYHQMKSQVSSLSSSLQELQLQLQAAESNTDKLKRSEQLWAELKSELETRLTLELGQKQRLQSQLGELEMRHSVELQGVKDNLTMQLSQRDIELSKLRSELKAVQEDLQFARSNPVVGMRASESVTPSKSLYNSFNDAESVVSNSTSASLLPGSLTNGEVSFAASEKLLQRKLQKEEEIKGMHAQILQLQVSRNALLDEVSYLSSRNAQLEEQLQALPSLKESFVGSQKQVEVLLGLLGEKEEELEAVTSDMKEVKFMYRSHMEELLEKLAPSPNKE